ncbi:MAG: isoleucine--tRNA ligase, partial [Candidatus Omnitrophica bacterium]|nr:isoleucine--tRNA ligase [Candidatus Omnitrophota bacterium]
DSVASKLSLENVKIVKKIPGKKLEGLVARHPFIERDSRVVLAEYVSNVEGTGCVHTAPGHGQDDYLTGRAYKLPTIMPVDQKGRFDNTAGGLKGLSIYKANAEILKNLSSSGDLLCREDISHSYPHCWRCKEPIIFRATEQYFMSIDKKGLRKKLLDVIKSKVRWIPDMGKGRISSMVENRPDWCLSRQRYWGVPIPAFYCADCGELHLDGRSIRNVAGIVEKEGSNAFFLRDPEQLLPAGTKCKKCKSANFKKETDIVDVWFESGVSHQAVLKRRDQFPSDLYLEGSDQHRGWFQSSLITAYAIEKRPPYASVLTHGFVVDGDGKKMSKSMGNVIAPQDIMKRYGADILRLWVASSDYNEDVRLSEEILKRLSDAYRKIRNTFKYLLSNIYDFDFKDVCPYKDMLEIDRWALGETRNLIDAVQSHYDNYNFHFIYHAIYNFCTVTMSSIYLDILKDRLYTFAAASHARRSAQSAMHIILSSLIRMLAPILSFTAEEAWGKMPGAGDDSVHLSAWPESDDIKCDKKLLEKYRTLFAVREKVLAELELARQAKIIGSPLEAKVVLKVKSGEYAEALKREAKELPSIFIVSQVEIDSDASPKAEMEIKVTKAAGDKCCRCWNYSESVGKDEVYKDLCLRCRDVIKTNSKEAVKR